RSDVRLDLKGAGLVLRQAQDDAERSRSVEIAPPSARVSRWRSSRGSYSASERAKDISRIFPEHTYEQQLGFVVRLRARCEITLRSVKTRGLYMTSRIASMITGTLFRENPGRTPTERVLETPRSLRRERSSGFERRVPWASGQSAGFSFPPRSWPDAPPTR